MKNGYFYPTNTKRETVGRGAFPSKKTNIHTSTKPMAAPAPAPASVLSTLPLRQHMLTCSWTNPDTAMIDTPVKAARWNDKLKTPDLEWLRDEYVSVDDPSELSMIWVTNYREGLGCVSPQSFVALMSKDYSTDDIRGRCNERGKSGHMYTLHYLLDESWACKPCFALINTTVEDMVEATTVFRNVLSFMWQRPPEAFVITVHPMERVANRGEASSSSSFWVTCLRGASFPGGVNELGLFVYGVMCSFLTPAQRRAIALPNNTKTRSFPMLGLVNELFDSEQFWIDPSPLVLAEEIDFYRNRSSEVNYRAEHVIYLCDEYNHPSCPEAVRPCKEHLKTDVVIRKIRPRAFLHSCLGVPPNTFEVPLDLFVDLCDRMFLWNVYKVTKSFYPKPWIEKVYNPDGNNAELCPRFTIDGRLKEYNLVFETLFGFTFKTCIRRSDGVKIVRFFGSLLNLTDEELDRREQEETDVLI